MLKPKDEEEILHFINDKILDFKRKYIFIANLLLPRIPNISNIASDLPQCAMNYTLKDILDFLIKAQQDGRLSI